MFSEKEGVLVEEEQKRLHFTLPEGNSELKRICCIRLFTILMKNQK